MKILVVGSGGREHALAWRLAAGHHDVVVTPGNAGIARELRCVVPEPGHAGIVQVARSEAVDLVVVGPEQPLVDGLVDALAAAGVPAFGPSAQAAQLEGSKAYMKAVCDAAGVATAPWTACASLAAARRFIEERQRAGKGVVVKADGLCAGKGVVVCPRAEDALAVARDMLGDTTLEGGAPPRFGDASRTVVIEDMLPGDELSVFALCDGHDALLFGAARDHKRLKDGDEGPNTGGMGAVAPVDGEPGLLERVKQTVVLPVLAEMRARGAPFRGVLFAGLMGEGADMRVLEFNVRFGDPETEALMMTTSADLAPLFLAVARGERLPHGARLLGPERAAVVVMAADGYPDAPKKGAVLRGLADAALVPGAKVFHAGVAEHDGALVAGGGRVLAVSARGASFDEALDRAYAAVDRISFDGAQLRRDIGSSVRAARRV